MHVLKYLFYVLADIMVPCDYFEGPLLNAWAVTLANEAFPYMADDTGGGVLNWAADNQLVLASEEDGWQHLYALSAYGGAPKLLTPGNCEVEQWSFTPDKKTLLFTSNCDDVDRDICGPLVFLGVLRRNGHALKESNRAP